MAVIISDIIKSNKSAEAFISSVAKLGFRSAIFALKSLIHSVKPSSDVSASLLRASISHSSASLHCPHHLSPPSKRLRFSTPPDGLLSELQVLAHIALLCVSHPRDAFPPGDLYSTVKLLHDNLMLFESDPVLLAEICGVCEEWWKRDLPERESVISLFLPVLLSKSLTKNKKVDVHKIFSLREAFELFDFEDESIEDLKLLLMHAVIAPVYWKSEDGQKFIASMFGLNMQLMKDAFAMINAQVLFGKKSMLDAYREILFRAWKLAKEDKLEAIENRFVQSLIESAILASSSSLSASIR